MIKLKKIEKIFSNKGNIYRIVDQKKLYPVKEVYITTVKCKFPKNWRKHINCDTVLVCLKGTIIIETERLKKFIKDDLKNIAIIKKNTKFRLISKNKNSFVMSFLKIPHKKLKTISYE